VKGVFDTRPGSGYDDDIPRRYHFPRQYRSIADALVGSWIVYREPQRKAGRRAYIAVARVTRVEDDLERTGHAYAYVADYLGFNRLVPFVSAGRYAEAPLREIGDSTRIGRYLRGRSVREMSDEDFGHIVRVGLGPTLAPENAVRLELDALHADHETQSLLEAPLEEQERRIEQILINRKIRDASFRSQVCEAYENRCAISGLRMVNGGGKPEVQAAHIWAVSDSGPDVVQNGIALSGTIHWLFDRHLISLTDDYRLLVSHNKVPTELRSLFQSQMNRIHLPVDRRIWPHPAYISRHRELFASG
jgi:putative restriction endonuclease